MKCPVCKSAGQRSVVHENGASVRTLMAAHAFWDEEGRRHYHDPNWNSAGYRCSNGHSFHESWRTACPVNGCERGHAEDDIRIHIDDPPRPPGEASNP